MQADAIRTAVDRIYDAPLVPGGWTAALVAIAEACRSQEATFSAESADGRAIEFIADHGLRPDDLARFEAVAAAGELPAWFHTMPLNTVSRQSDMWSERCYVRSVIYNEFVKYTDSYYAMQMPLVREPEQHIRVIVARMTGRDDYDKDDVAALQSLAPHLGTALKLSQRLAALDLAATGACAALDRLAAGVIVVDAGSAVHFANMPAQMAMRRPGPLGLDEEGLRTSDPRSTRLLRTLVANCNRRVGTSGGGGTVDIVGSDGRAPLRVLVAPFAPEMVQWDMALRGAKRPAAILTFVDQQEGREARIARLRRRFELTAAEADVAQAVMQGGCRADVAARLGITVATVRAHLSHIFEKVGVHRQAELVRRILQSDRDDS